MCLGGFKAPIQISDRENISEVGLAFLASKEVPVPPVWNISLRLVYPYRHKFRGRDLGQVLRSFPN